MNLSRRSFAKLAGCSVAAASLASVLSACAGESGSSASGSTASSSSASGSTASGASTSGVVGTEAGEQVIVAISAGSEPEGGFDPALNWGCGEHMHEPLIQSTLVRTDADLNIINDLATGYEVSSDGLTWEFTIRDDVVFSDGEPLTAEDVAFTFSTIASSEASEADLSMVAEAVATSPTTVELHMSRPYNALLYLLAVVGILPKHAYSQDYGYHPIGSGRYLLEQWDQGQQAIFAANPLYYGQAPKIGRVVVLFMEEDASMAAALSGQVDLAFTSATLAGNVPDGYEVLSCKSVDSRGLSLPVVPLDGDRGNDVTCNLEIRRAINMGVDRDRFVNNVLNGYGTVAYSVGTGMPWYSDDMEVEYDPEAATALLEGAGWSKGADGIYEKSGQRASIDVFYMSSDSVRQAIALEFGNQMAEIGIEVKASGMSWDDLSPHMYTTPAVWGFGSNAPFEIYSLYHSEGGFNCACYENAVVDSYMDEALATSTLEESFPLWQKAQWDGRGGIAPKGDAPWVWLANIDHLFFQRDGLTVAAQKPHPHGHGWSVLNNVDEWSW